MTHWAAQYLGKPWVSGASGPDAYDCYGLILAVYREQYGVDLPLLNVDATRSLSIAKAMRDYEYGDWQPVDAQCEGDVIQMGHARHPHHVGLWLDSDGGRILHSLEGSGVVAQTPASLRLHGWNILTIYRRRS